MRKLILLFTMLVFTVGAKIYAQSAEEQKKWVEYMTPSEAHKMIAKYDGDWNESISMWMTPNTPPTISKTFTHNEMILGGRYQKSIHKGTMMGLPFEGFSILGYDNGKKEYFSTWLDNFGTGTMTMQGNYNEATKSINLKGKLFDCMTNKDNDVKEIVTLVDNNTQKIEMYLINETGESKIMEINSTRAKDAAVVPLKKKLK